MKNSVIIFIISIGLISCNEKSPDCGDPGQTYCELLIKDTNGILLTETKYDQDSISLKVNNNDIHVDFMNGEIVFNFSGFESYNTFDYILKLDHTDSDTLHIYVRKFKNDCWTGNSIDTFRYNNQLINRLAENKFIIIK